MQIVENKALLIRTKRGREILDIIPRSSLIADNGPVQDVLVHWGLQEAVVLKNLAIKNVPSPILRDYDWPGMFTPFKHQKTTASFLTLHKKAFCFNETGCVDADTEYLSPTGWRRIADYTEGEVGQYIPETGTVEFVTPSEYVKLPCTEMIRIKTTYGLDQLLSPEHRMLIHSNAQDKWCVMSAQELLNAHNDFHDGVSRPNARKAGCNTVSFSHAAIPCAFKGPEMPGLPLSDAQLRVQVAVIADGHFHASRKPDNTYCVVRLKRQRKKDRLRALLTEAGIDFRERLSTAPTAPGYSIFTFKAPLKDKEFDEKYWQCSRQQMALLAEEIPHWDGSFNTRNTGVRFTSTSRASAEFVQYVYASQGRVARLSVNVREGREKRPCYDVVVRSIKNKGLLSLFNRQNRTMSQAPSTDGYKYCFMVPSTFLIFRRNGCIFASGNTAKTSSAIWAADYLMRHNIVKRALIVCPLSIMHSVWLSELFKTAMHRTAAVAYGSQFKRLQVVEGEYEFVIINFDGIKILQDALIGVKFDLIIVDEATSFKNVSTKRWKAMQKIVQPDTWLWMMTGSPAAQSPYDAYGLARLVCPERVPRYAGSFKDKVMQRISQFKWVPRINATEIVYDALQPAIRFTKEQCLDLPPLLYETRETPLSKNQELYYKKMKSSMVFTAGGEVVSAMNAAVLIGKLLQIAAGAVFAEDRDVVEFDVTPRYNVLKEVLDETEHKVILFVNFKNVITLLEEKLTADGYSVATIHGGVPVAARTSIFEQFQTERDPKVIIIQPQAAAHGVTLHAADTVVWWGPITSTETYLQGNARAYRAGQTKSVTVIHLQGAEVEKRLYRMLQDNIDIHSKLVDLYIETAESRLF